MPHRVLRTGLVEKLESGSRLRGFSAAVRNGQKFKKLSKMTWRSMISDSLEMRHGKLTWAQVVMAANTDAGVLASGQVAGILDDLPSYAELIETIVGDAVKTPAGGRRPRRVTAAIVSAQTVNRHRSRSSLPASPNGPVNGRRWQ